MSTLGANFLTLSDWARRIDPDGKVAAIAEVMNQFNEILDDMIWTEGNLPTGHRSTIRTGMPAVTWRKLYQGVQQSKGGSVQVDDSCGMLEGYSEIDKRIADLNGNTAEFRASEDMAFLEAMSQDFASKLIYGDTDTDPEKILGLSARYPNLSSSNVLGANGTGSDVSSIWLVVWGPQTVFGVFPKGSKAGFQSEDKGQVTLFDASGRPFEGYRTHYQWDCGLVVRDWRYVVRIANVETTGTSNTVTTNLLNKALRKIPSMGMGRPAFYMNNDVLSQFDTMAEDKTNIQLTTSELANGKLLTKYKGIPLRRVDQILSTETAIN